jgi:exodeoxyribonuclease VII small subunit
MGTKKTVGAEKQTVSFEQALQRLDAIVREMEAGSLSLDTMIQRFEEGQALIGVCNRKLNEVERKIEMLVKKDGETKAVPFEDEAEDVGEDNGKNGKEKKDGGESVPF